MQLRISLSSKGALLTRIQLGGQQGSQVLFCRAALQLGGPQHILVPVVVPPWMQDSALLAELHEIVSPCV